MRNAAAILAVMIILCAAAGAYGGERTAARKGDMAQFANELAAKIVYRSDAGISVNAQDCHLHIEYGALNVAFDLPLQGTTMDEAGTDDGILLRNKYMTRTIKDRNPEAFEAMLLRFHRNDIEPMMKVFERAIRDCSATGPTVAFVR